MKKFVIFPEKIALIDASRIQDGTITDFATLQSDASAFLVPRRSEDGVSVKFSGDSVQIQEQAENGLLLLSDQFRKSLGVSVDINVGQWNFEIEAILRGQNLSDVNEAQTASIAGADDSTAITGLDFANAFTTQKLTALLMMPKDKDTSDVLYYYLPKTIVDASDREQALTTDQQKNTITLTALALQDDETTAHQALVGGVNAHSLIFPISGQPDAV